MIPTHPDERIALIGIAVLAAWLLIADVIPRARRNYLRRKGLTPR